MVSQLTFGLIGITMFLKKGRSMDNCGGGGGDIGETSPSTKVRVQRKLVLQLAIWAIYAVVGMY